MGEDVTHKGITWVLSTALFVVLWGVFFWVVFTPSPAVGFQPPGSETPLPGIKNGVSGIPTEAETDTLGQIKQIFQGRKLPKAQFPDKVPDITIPKEHTREFGGALGTLFRSGTNISLAIVEPILRSIFPDTDFSEWVLYIISATVFTIVFFSLVSISGIVKLVVLGILVMSFTQG